MSAAEAAAIRRQADRLGLLKVGLVEPLQDRVAAAAQPLRLGPGRLGRMAIESAASVMAPSAGSKGLPRTCAADHRRRLSAEMFCVIRTLSRLRQTEKMPVRSRLDDLRSWWFGRALNAEAPSSGGSGAGAGLDTIAYHDYIRPVIDWPRVEGFEWDDGNARKSHDRHAVSQAEAEQVFFSEPLLIVKDPRYSVHEPRFHALGRTDEGRPLHVTFTLRSAATLIRVISARDMSRKERARHAQES